MNIEPHGSRRLEPPKIFSTPSSPPPQNHRMSIILPGDPLPEHNEDTVLGPGIYRVPLKDAIPTKAGIFASKQHRKTGQIDYVETNSKRYTPALKDQVVGVVTAKNSEGYRVTLQDHTTPVRLDQFAFENASKKNKPNLNIGSVVYARVSFADKDIEAEIECYDASTGKSAGFGELKGGFVFDVSLGFARHLLFKGHQVLNSIGETTPFEIAIGMNGKIWVDAPDKKTIWKISRCIQSAETVPENEVPKLVKKILSS